MGHLGEILHLILKVSVLYANMVGMWSLWIYYYTHVIITLMLTGAQMRASRLNGSSVAKV